MVGRRAEAIQWNSVAHDLIHFDESPRPKGRVSLRSARTLRGSTSLNRAFQTRSVDAPQAAGNMTLRDLKPASCHVCIFACRYGGLSAIDAGRMSLERFAHMQVCAAPTYPEQRASALTMLFPPSDSSPLLIANRKPQSCSCHVGMSA